MSITPISINAARSADFVARYDAAAAVNVLTYTPLLRVYDALGGNVLLQITDEPNPNGSVLTVSENTVTVFIQQDDVNALPVGLDPTQVNVLFFDTFLTSADDVETKIHGGYFNVQPVGYTVPITRDSIKVSLNSVVTVIDFTQGLSAIRGPQGVPTVNTRIALRTFRSRYPITVYCAGLTSMNDGYQGYFMWMPGDQSVNIALDPSWAVWVPSSYDPTAATGAWKRVFLNDYEMKWWNAKGDSDGYGNGTDNTIAFQRAFDFVGANGGGYINVTDGCYAINSGTTFNNDDVKLRATGLVQYDATLLQAPGICMKASGSYGPEIPLSAQAVRGQETINVNNHGLHVGDWFLIMSNLDSLDAVNAPAGWRLGGATGSGSPCFYAEPMQIKSVTTNTITMTSGLIFPMYDTIAAAPQTRVSTIKKIHFLNGIEIIGGEYLMRGRGVPLDPTTPARTSANVGIRLDWCYRPKVTNVTADLSFLPGAGLYASACYNGEYTGLNAFHDVGWTKMAWYVPVTAPTGLDHSLFNSFKDMGSWNSRWEYWDYIGSQGLDVTYATGIAPYFPSMNTDITPHSLRSNETGVTFHSGSYRGCIRNALVIDSADTGIYCRTMGVTIINANIMSSRIFTGGSAAILIEFATDCQVLDSKFEGYPYGVKNNLDTTGGVGAYTRNLTIKGCVFRLCGQSIRIVKSGTAAATALPSGVIISNCTISMCSDDGIVIDDYVNSVIINNVFFENLTGTTSSNGIVLPPNSVNNRISNITGYNIGAPSSLIRCSAGINDFTTFPVATYPTQGNYYDWSTIKLNPGGTGKLYTLHAGYCNSPTGDYTLVPQDVNTSLYVNSSTACTISVPDEITALMPPGGEVAIYAVGAGAVSVAGLNTSVVVKSPQGLRLIQPNGRALLKKQYLNTWFLSGALTFPVVNSYRAETNAYISQMWVPPSDARAGVIDALIGGLIDDGVWARLDWLTLHAAHHYQAGLLNAHTPTKLMAMVNAPAFTVDRGWTGNGTSSYLSMQEHYDAAGNLFARDDNHLGVWIRAQGGASGQGYQMGVEAGSALFFIMAHSSGDETFRDADVTTDTSRTASVSRIGFRVNNRPGPTSKQSFFNGSIAADLTTASTGVSSGNGVVLHHGTGYVADQAMFTVSGKSLNTTQMTALYNRLNTYRAAVGA